MSQLLCAKTIVSCLGVGYLRPASGTWGSAAAGILLYLIYPSIPWWWKLAMIVVVFFIGARLGTYIEKKEGLHDPSFFVIDEATGMMITTFFLHQVWWQFVLAFVLFRIFDIIKIWPASYIDQKTGGVAAMLDDCLMAIPAMALLWVCIRLFG